MSQSEVKALVRRDLAQRLWDRHMRKQQSPGAAATSAEPGPAASFPLSFGQERLWCAERIHPDAGLYNIVEVRSVEDRVDCGALESSLNEVIKRHEVLRTVIVETGDGPVQRVLPVLRVQIPHVDLTALSDEAQNDWIGRLGDAYRGIRFDLATGPLLQFVLVTLRAGRHLVWMMFHHIIADGWSARLFERELKTMYHAWSSRGQPVERPPKPQYREFAARQRAGMTPPLLESRLAQACAMLRDAPPWVPLPAAVGITCRRARRIPVAVDTAMRQRIEVAARSEGATLFMAALAAFAAAVSDVSGANDLVIGTPVSERRDPTFDDTIGYFLNTLALRMRVVRGLTWRDLLLRAREAVVAAHAISDVPFQHVVERLGAGGRYRSTPLFNVWFTLVSVPPCRSPRVLEPWTPLAVQGSLPQFDLTCVLHEERAALSGFLEYDISRVDGSAADAIAGRLSANLVALAANSDTPLLTPTFSF